MSSGLSPMRPETRLSAPWSQRSPCRPLGGRLDRFLLGALDRLGVGLLARFLNQERMLIRAILDLCA